MIAVELCQELDIVNFLPLLLMLRTEMSRDAGERGHFSLTFHSGGNRAEMPFYRSIIQ